MEARATVPKRRKAVATVATVATVAPDPVVKPSPSKAKKASVAPVAPVAPVVPVETGGASGPDSVKPKAKAASKKKQFSVVAVVTPTTIEGSLQPESRKPLIAHLPIHSKDIFLTDSLIQYNPAPPSNVEPYDAAVCDPFMEGAELLETANVTVEPTGASGASAIAAITGTVASVATTATGTAATGTVASTVTTGATGATVATIDVPDYYKKATLLVQFQSSDEIKVLPDRVDVACFWCCHTFDWRPVVLPVRDQGDYIQVQGNFCCPECAMASLFDSRQDSFARWEQLSLLNRIYGSSSGTDGTLRPAPPRTILKMFGGPMTIEDYRSLIRKGKMRIDIHVPPMVSLLATMDTKPIDFYDVSLTKNVMETVGERLAKAEEVLKLKRTKPLKAWESTLDACINLKVRS